MTGHFIFVGYLKNLMNVPLCLIMFVSYFFNLSNIVKMEKPNLIQQMLDMKKKHQDTKKRKLEDEAPKPDPKKTFVRIGKMGDPGLSLKMEKCSVHGAKIDAKMTLDINVISLKAVITLK